MQELVKYEPRHKIILWDDRELFIKSEHVSKMEQELQDSTRAFIRIGDDLINKKSIRMVTPAESGASELETVIAGQPPEIKKRVREWAKQREAQGFQSNESVFRKMLEKALTGKIE